VLVQVVLWTALGLLVLAVGLVLLLG
jgi:hypothetical protein